VSEEFRLTFDYCLLKLIENLYSEDKFFKM